MQDYYNSFNGGMILRDMLALDRTRLANERTLLAYMRTALTLFIAGVTFIRFFGYAVFVVTGWIFIPLGLLVGVVGFVHFRRLKLPLERLKQKEPRENSPEIGQQHK